MKNPVTLSILTLVSARLFTEHCVQLELSVSSVQFIMLRSDFYGSTKPKQWKWAKLKLPKLETFSLGNFLTCGFSCQA